MCVYTLALELDKNKCGLLLPSADTGEAESTRGAAECEEAHPLVLLKHQLLPAATSGPQGGHQPVL